MRKMQRIRKGMRGMGRNAGIVENQGGNLGNQDGNAGNQGENVEHQGGNYKVM